RMRGSLLGREQAGSEPSVDRRLRDAELVGGLLDGEQVAGGAWWWRGGDPVLGAQVRDARLVERQAGAGAAALLVEDRGDLLITRVGSQLADQVDRVLAGPVALGSAPDERHGQLGVRGAFPDDLNLGSAWLLVDRDDHFADQ